MKWIFPAFILGVFAGISSGEEDKTTLEEITKELATIKAEIGRLRKKRENPMAELQQHKTENKLKAEFGRLSDEADEQNPEIGDVLIDEQREICIDEIKRFHRVYPVELGDLKVSFEHGQAEATSYQDKWEKRFGPQLAFKRQIFKSILDADRTYPWVSEAGLPHTVAYRFPEALTVRRFSFRSRAENSMRYPTYKNFLNQSPTEFDFVGSNDCKKWKKIMKVKNVTWSTFDQEQEWIVHGSAAYVFVCFGIRILKNGGDPFSAIQDLKMWTTGVSWREDQRCGPDFPINGVTSTCDPNREFPCCSKHWRCNKCNESLTSTSTGDHHGKKTLEEITKELANIKAEIGSLREERENPMVELQHHKTENKQKAEFGRLRDEGEKQSPEIEELLIDETREICVDEIRKYHQVYPLVLGEVQVSFEHGEAKATSYYERNLERYGPALAFKRQKFKSILDADRTYPWLSEAGLPQTIYYRFPIGLTVKKFSFRSRAENSTMYPMAMLDSYLNHSPTEFDFVGSNDCETWKKIMHVKGVTWSTFDQEQKWIIRGSAAYVFVCFGITILKTGGYPYAAIQDFKMWKPGVSWREDERCGPDFPINGVASICDPNGESPCCSKHWLAPNTCDKCHVEITEYTIQDTGYIFKDPDSDTRYWQGSSTCPQYIGFIFDTPHILTGINLTAHRNALGPKHFKVVGSNNCANWTTMVEVADSGFPNNYQPGASKYFSIPKATRVAYLCIGLNISSVIGADFPPEIKSIVLWEDAK